MYFLFMLLLYKMDSPPPGRPPLLVRQTMQGTDFNWLWEYKRETKDPEWRKLIVDTFYSPNISREVVERLTVENKIQLLVHRRIRERMIKYYQGMRLRRIEEGLIGVDIPNGAGQSVLSNLIAEYLNP